MFRQVARQITPSLNYRAESTAFLWRGMRFRRSLLMRCCRRRTEHFSNTAELIQQEFCALWTNLRNGGVSQGGSTITQQYVKNVYLTQERTFTRKIKEAALAVKVERELPKQEILTRYLNTIYLGRGAYGIEAASRVYFGKILIK